MRRTILAALVLMLLLLPLAALAQTEGDATLEGGRTFIGGTVDSEPSPEGDATTTIGVNVAPAMPPAEVPPTAILPVIPLLAGGFAPFILLISWILGRLGFSFPSDRINFWVGTILGAALALLTYLTGVFPHTTWMQSLVSMLASILGPMLGGPGAGFLHDYVARPLSGEAPTRKSIGQ